MLRRLTLALALTLLPGLARAAERPAGEPEQLLPANAQLYVRWDGLKSHRAAYDKTFALAPKGNYLRREAADKIVGLMRKHDRLRTLAGEWERAWPDAAREAGAVMRDTREEEKTVSDKIKILAVGDRAMVLLDEDIEALVFGMRRALYETRRRLPKARAHGRDERMRVQSFYEGQEFLYRLTKALTQSTTVTP